MSKDKIKLCTKRVRQIRERERQTDRERYADRQTDIKSRQRDIYMVRQTGNRERQREKGSEN